MGDVEVLHAELAVLAARFVLPGHGPDVDQAIRLACELMACELDTPATVDVAALRYGTPLRDACPLLREMLQEQGFPAPGPDASQTGEFRAVLRALAAGSLAVGEFYIILIDHQPTWDGQDELDRRLMALLDDWELQTTPEGLSYAKHFCRHASQHVSRQGAGFGQLGDGTTTNSPVPVQVSGHTPDWATVSDGLGHTCAEKTEGTVWCWGWNIDGQLGDGTTTDSPVPVQVSGM